MPTRGKKQKIQKKLAAMLKTILLLPPRAVIINKVYVCWRTSFSMHRLSRLRSLSNCWMQAHAGAVVIAIITGRSIQSFSQSLSFGFTIQRNHHIGDVTVQKKTRARVILIKAESLWFVCAGWQHETGGYAVVHVLAGVRPHFSFFRGH